MLVYASRSRARYVIALNNASDGLEVVADLSYLEGAPAGELLFDLRHMAAPLTLEQREAGRYLPGSFGYQPTRQLLEVVSHIQWFASNGGLAQHRLTARFPTPQTRVGRFLLSMNVDAVLRASGLNVCYVAPANPELGVDDTTRQNLIPITEVQLLPSGGLDFAVIGQMRNRTAAVFARATGGNDGLADQFSTIVSEAVDNMIDYGAGGLIGGLYYPSIGEVEVTLINRRGGFGGSTPEEQLDVLVAACEGRSARAAGGGNGIAQLSDLAAACFGTLVFRNGNATLRLLPDGSIAGTTEQTGLAVPGASVTILLQLLPAGRVERNETMKRYECAIAASLERYARERVTI